MRSAPVAEPRPLSSTPSARHGWARGGAVVAAALVLIALAYSNALPGAFVYDDTQQIAANPFVRDPTLLGKALLSDVWVYKGDEQHAASNYWRPMFVAWMSLNHAMFGVAPRGWHVTSILLHALVTILVWLALRAVAVRPAACAFAAWLFAVHPVHVESVTWVSGSPDLLLAGFMVGAFVVHLAARDRTSWALRSAAIALHAGAVLSKEIGVVFPAIVFVTEWALAARDGKADWETVKRALRAAIPYAVVSIAFVIARLAVLGQHRFEIPGAAGIGDVLLSAPRVFLFYVHQVFFPFPLGPTYGLAAVTPATAGFANLVAPALAVLAVAWGAVFAVRKDPAVAIGLAWFALTLAPALDLRSFQPENLVHDRYLYLALAGILAIGGAAWVGLWEQLLPSADASGTGRDRRGRRDARTAEAVCEPRAAWLAALVLALALVPVTRSYNRVWRDEISLWERGTRTNSTTSFAYSQLGGPYRQAGRLKEAREALTHAIALNPNSKTANLSLGTLEVREGRYREAEEHLKLVLRQYPDDRVATEQLASAYQKQGKLDEALSLFERARQARPRLRAIYGVNIAVLHRMAGRADAALAELESLRGDLETADEHGAIRGLWFLGELYRERGRTEEAKGAYASYLAATATMHDPDAEALRATVAEHLRTLER